MAVNNPYALNFDGVDDYVVLGDIIDVKSSDFTIEMLVLYAGSTKENLQLLITNKQYVGDYRFNIEVRPDGTISIYSRTTSTSSQTVYSSYKLTINKVYFLSFVRQDNKCHIFVDGEHVDTIGVKSGNIGSNSLWSLGARYGTSEYFFNGVLDEVRIWNRALVEPEIKKYMYKQLTGKEPGLVAYYRCDNDNADNSVLQDYTGNGNDGTIYGASYVPGFVDLDEPDPVIVAKEATNILGDTATLNGEILHLANHASLDVAFQYSPYPDFSRNVRQTPIQTITSPQLISANISGLNNSLGYYTRIMAQESS